MAAIVTHDKRMWELIEEILEFIGYYDLAKMIRTSVSTTPHVRPSLSFPFDVANLIREVEYVSYWP